MAFHQSHQYRHSSQPGVGAALTEGAAATASFTASLVSLAAAAASFAAPAAVLASNPAFLITDSNPLMSGRMSIWNIVAFTSSLITASTRSIRAAWRSSAAAAAMLYRWRS
ncbi:MAG: hypothetical protein ACK559_21685, partial [bacterium]